MLFLYALATSIVGFAAAGPVLTSRSQSGQATYYGGNTQGGACSFSTYTIPSGLYGTAITDGDWDNSANCGRCVSVTYSGKSVTAMVRQLGLLAFLGHLGQHVDVDINFV